MAALDGPGLRQPQPYQDVAAKALDDGEALAPFPRRRYRDVTQWWLASPMPDALVMERPTHIRTRKGAS